MPRRHTFSWLLKERESDAFKSLKPFLKSAHLHWGPASGLWSASFHQSISETGSTAAPLGLTSDIHHFYRDDQILSLQKIWQHTGDAPGFCTFNTAFELLHKCLDMWWNSARLCQISQSIMRDTSMAAPHSLEAHSLSPCLNRGKNTLIRLWVMLLWLVFLFPCWVRGKELDFVDTSAQLVDRGAARTPWWFQEDKHLGCDFVFTLGPFLHLS